MSVDACAALVQAGDPLRFRTAMMAPLDVRADLLVLYAFNVEVSRAPWVTAEPMIAQMRLQWWVDALSQIGEGAPRRHEVVTPLADVVARRSIDVDALSALVEARRFDIDRDPHVDRDAFNVYISATYAALTKEAARICGAKGDALEVAFEFGSGVGVAAQFAGFKALYAAGRDPLWGKDHNRSAATNGAPDAVSIDKVSSIARMGIDSLSTARRRRRSVPKTCRPALLIGHGATTTLRAAAKDPASVFQEEFGAVSESKNRLSFVARYLSGRW